MSGDEDKAKRPWQFSLMRAMTGVGLLCVALSSISVFRVIPELTVLFGPPLFCASVGGFVAGRIGIVIGLIVGLCGSVVLYVAYVALAFWTLIHM